MPDSFLAAQRGFVGLVAQQAHLLPGRFVDGQYGEPVLGGQYIAQPVFQFPKMFGTGVAGKYGALEPQQAGLFAALRGEPARAVAADVVGDPVVHGSKKLCIRRPAGTGAGDAVNLCIGKIAKRKSWFRRGAALVFLEPGRVGQAKKKKSGALLRSKTFRAGSVCHSGFSFFCAGAYAGLR